MKGVLGVITVLLLVAGFVSLTVNDVQLLRDLRFAGRRIFDEASDKNPFADDAETEPWDSYTEFTRENIDREDYLDSEVMTLQADGSFSRVLYKGINTDLHLVLEERDDFEIQWYASEPEASLEMEKDNGMLKIQEQNKQLLDNTLYTVTIFIPETYRKEIQMELVNASVYAEELRSPVRLEAVNGEVTLHMEEAMPVTMGNVNGNLTVLYREKTLQDVKYDLSVVNGEINVMDQVETSGAGPKEARGSWGKGFIPVKMETVNGTLTLDKWD